MGYIAFVNLRQRVFYHCRRHVENCNNPHPENSARAAERNGDGDTGEIPGTNTRCKAETQRPPRGNTSCDVFSLIKSGGEKVAKVTKLNETKTERKVNAGAA